MSRAFRADEILPGIFLGGCHDASNLEGLRAKGITHILNVADDVINYHPDHFTYLRLDVKDYGMDEGMGRVFCQGLEFVQHATGPVLIHCMMGVNRSATMTVVVAMVLRSWTLREAFEHVEKCRPMVSPMEDNQRELIKYEKKIRGGKSDIPKDWAPNL